MPRPSSGTTIQRADLSQLAWEYMSEASRTKFIGLQLLPLFPVTEQSADYPVIPIESILKLPDTRRAARGTYNRSDYNFETGTYSCDEYGWEELVDDKEKKLYQRFFAAEAAATERSVDHIMRSQELRISSMLFNTSNLANAAVAVAWSTPGTATPRVDVNGRITAMKAASGLVPNVGACSDEVFRNLVNTSEVKDALKYTNPVEMGGLEVQKQMMAQYFGLDRILVGNGIYDSAKKGQSFSITDIWDDDYFGLFKVADSMSLKEPSIGRTFLWTEDSPSNLVVEQYREEQSRANIYRARNNVDEAFVFTGAGQLLTGCTA
jgi:hypothetical protein